MIFNMANEVWKILQHYLLVFANYHMEILAAPCIAVMEHDAL